MTEEINEDNINKLLESLPDNLTAVERMIMANEGTVQTFLSVLCGQPVKVEVISQKEFAGNIIRWVKLIIEKDDIPTTVCLAESIIPISNGEQFNTLINERKLGIGQIIRSLDLNTSRQIMGFHSDSRTIARTYAIEGDCNVIITEVFNRDVISKISSTGVKSHHVSGDGCVIGPMNLGELNGLLSHMKPNGLLSHMNCGAQTITKPNTEDDGIVKEGDNK